MRLRGRRPPALALPEAHFSEAHLSEAIRAALRRITGAQRPVTTVEDADEPIRKRGRESVHIEFGWVAAALSGRWLDRVVGWTAGLGGTSCHGMKILVVGGTRGTGMRVAEEAARRGHAVTVTARHAPSPAPPWPVKVVDATDEPALRLALSGQEGVVCAVGGGRKLGPQRLREQATECLVRAMQSEGLQRLVVVSSLGAGDSVGSVPFLVRTILRNPMKDHTAQEKVVRQSHLEWTVVRPGRLTDGPEAGFRIGEDGKLQNAKVSRRELGRLIVDLLEQSRYLEQTIAVG